MARPKQKFYFGTFNNPKNVIGEDREYPLKKVSKGPPENPAHEGDPPFRPYGTSTNKKEMTAMGTFEFFPGSQKGEIKVTKRVKVDPDAEEKPRFKMTKNGRSAPVTSIATNSRNLKASYPQFFRK